LRKNREIQVVLKTGRRWVGPLVAVHVRQVAGPSRLGVCVSRKVGGAVQRNRTRRRLAEWCRRGWCRVRSGVEIVLVARAGAAERSGSELTESLAAVWQQARLWEEGKSRSGETHTPPAHRGVPAGLPMDPPGLPL
jgi:ribonuclease P protein component